MKRAKIVVIGSINMDLVLQVPRLPKPGETLSGGDMQQIPGGKGANQAVAASRLGADVHMVGCVGDDAFGPILRAEMESSGVKTRYVRTTKGASGVAVILLQANGDNSIALSGGANQRMTIKDVKAALPVLRCADAVLLQLEIPIAVASFAASLCRKLGVRVILDPAPATTKLPRALLDVDILCPNQVEAQTLLDRFGVRGEAKIALALLAKGPRAVVLKLGSRGSLHVGSQNKITRASAFKVNVVDTTAAGDSMTAGLAVAIAEGKSWTQSLAFANAAGAAACTKLGAQSSIPTRAQVQRILRVQN